MLKKLNCPMHIFNSSTILTSINFYSSEKLIS